MSEVYLVTGANSGLGLESVRRLVGMSSTKKVYMACRSSAKADKAIAFLQQADTNLDTSKLEYLHFDAMESKQNIVKTVQSVKDTLTGVLLNAGGIGHDKSVKPSGPNNVLEVHQINLIAHIQLVEALKESSKMAEGCTIVFSGSEAARGVPMMMIAPPKMGNTREWFEEQLHGKAKKDKDPMVRYAKTKGFAALYFAEWARLNPKYKVLVVSPGGTAGTAALSAQAVPGHFKVMMPVMMPLMKMMGVMHPLEVGSQRYIQALMGDEQFASGTFVASKRGTTGKLADQTLLRTGKQYGDMGKQQAAYDALHPMAAMS